jgi:tetratricopeptide (TPR) repeat protein
MTIQSSYYDLGEHHRQITTNSSKAQIWFNRGLIWSYGFNHQESAACFNRAIEADPDCAMAYWGLAYALGPNYNKPWSMFDEEDLRLTVKEAHRAARTAGQKARSTTAIEKALCHAIQFRYAEDEPIEDHRKWNQDYADAMAKAYEAFPDDLDVATLYSDALMNLKPWNLWDIRTGEPNPKAPTLKVKAVLDQALKQDGCLKHPGILHLYIHLMEMSNVPETALSAADHLRSLVPDSGHLCHMPSHIYVILGDYFRTVSSNQDAIEADEKFAAGTIQANFYTLYRVHDYHFCVYGAMFAGTSKIALDTVTRMEAAIPEELLRMKSPPMADWLEAFVPMRVHVLIRFGRWKDLMNLALPKDQELYAMTTALILYGKGVALAATGDIEAAQRQRKIFLDAVKRVPESRALFNNACADILKIADAMLEGEIEYRRGNYDAAFKHLKNAVHLDDTLPYDEPWGWMQPARHAYGALLLEQNHVEEAAAVYRADLGLDGSLPRPRQHPNNVWALHGYYECLKRLGRTSEAATIEQQLKLAVAVADVPILSSCSCRRNTSNI